MNCRGRILDLELHAFPPPRASLLLLLVSFVLPPSLSGQEEEDSSAIGVTGFISATLFGQDRLFAPGNGQQAQRVSDAQDGPDGWWHGGDIRNTRLAVDVSTSGLGGRWSGGGRLEFDLFGGFTTGSGFDQEQLLPRIRLAYVEARTDATTVRVGQDWAPLYLHVPASVSHLAFPPGYGSAGLIGWRFPGIFVNRRLLNERGLTATVRGALMRGAWEDDDPPPNAGQSSLFPQVELRLDLERSRDDGADWEVFIAGHVDRKEIDFDPEQRLDGWAFTASARFEPEPVTLQGGGYRGRAVGQHAAHISQFGDIRGWGAWIQGGYAITPRWSAWAFAGLDDPDDDDLDAGEALRNEMINLMLRFETGALEFGVEWLVARTQWRETPPDGASPDRTRTGRQLALGTVLHF
jgi:hypothetical protein